MINLFKKAWRDLKVQVLNVNKSDEVSWYMKILWDYKKLTIVALLGALLALGVYFLDEHKAFWGTWDWTDIVGHEYVGLAMITVAVGGYLFYRKKVLMPEWKAKSKEYWERLKHGDWKTTRK